MNRWSKYCVVCLSCCILLSVSYLYYKQHIRMSSNLDWKEMLPYFASKGDAFACSTYFEFGGVLNRNPSMVFLDGQKSVCLDEGVAPVPGDCLIYSFGNNGEWSFDEQMEAYGCSVFAFDPSGWYWNHRHSKNIWFYRVGIGVQDVERDKSRGWRIMTLSSLRQMLNHTDRIIDYLKMDIEGGEWPVLADWLSSGDVSQIKQLSMEIHLQEPESFAAKYDLLHQLEGDSTSGGGGFVRFFARENPWSRGDYLDKFNVADASCYELAWYNSKFYSTK